MRTMTNLMYALLLIASATVARSNEIPAKAQSHPIALVGGTIHTVSGAIIEKGTIVFAKGKITAIGTSVEIPEGAERIDVSGKHVYPGMIDARSTIGLTEIGSVRATNDISETGSINPNIRAEVSVNPESELIPVTRVNGVTTAVTMPDGGVISGSAAAISLDGWTWEEMTVRAPVGLVVNWPQMTINRSPWERRTEEEQKKSRERAINELRNAFRDARAYMMAKKAESRKDIPYHNTDLRWEAIIPVLEGKVPVFMAAEEIQQIQAAVAWAERENVRMVLLGGYDSWRCTELLKQRGIPVVVNPTLRTPRRRFDPYDDPATLPKKLFDAGVKFCIAADGGASNERNLPYNAAMASSYGLPRAEALKAVTIYAAEMMGLSDRLGALESGKDATLIVTDGDPLEIMTNVERIFIFGKSIPTTSRHTRLFEKYKEKYSRLGSGGK